MNSASPIPAAPTLVEHYAQYFATPRQLAWYELMAEDKAANIIDMCSDLPHESILDIGAGDGAVLNQLDAHGFGSKLHAIDISESGIKALHQKTWRSLVSATKFDGSTVPFADQSFDLAILSHVVEHLEHPRIALREAARVARRVYVEVPLEFVLLNRRLRREFQLDATGHINFYNPMLIRLLVQSSGLCVLKQQVRHFTPKAYLWHKGKRGWINYWIKEAALRLSSRLATKVFNYHCGLVCAADTRPPPTAEITPHDIARAKAAATSSSPSESARRPPQAG